MNERIWTDYFKDYIYMYWCYESILSFQDFSNAVVDLVAWYTNLFAVQSLHCKALKILYASMNNNILRSLSCLVKRIVMFNTCRVSCEQTVRSLSNKDLVCYIFWVKKFIQHTQTAFSEDENINASFNVTNKFQLKFTSIG